VHGFITDTCHCAMNRAVYMFLPIAERGVRGPVSSATALARLLQRLTDVVQ
jgi:hypothetical protein